MASFRDRIVELAEAKLLKTMKVKQPKGKQPFALTKLVSLLPKAFKPKAPKAPKAKSARDIKHSMVKMAEDALANIWE